MATIIIGHGSIETSDEPRLVPPGFKISFFSDFGSDLIIPSYLNGEGEEMFDYTAIADAWQHYKTAGYVGEYDVTYNLGLSAVEPEELQHARSLEWGATVITPGDPLPADTYLCTGTERDPETGAGTCPTPALLVKYKAMEAEGTADQFNADWWNHDCDGLLGRLGAQHADGDIYWVSCSGFGTNQVPEGAALPDTYLKDQAPNP